MKKYKEFLNGSFSALQVFVAILAAILMFICIACEMSAPINATELEQNYNQLELVKQDVSSIHKLHNATIEITEQGMVLTLNGTINDLKANFDTDDNYISAEIIDNRIGSNVISSILAIMLAFGFAYMVMTCIEMLLYIPVGIYNIVIYVQDKRSAKNET